MKTYNIISIILLCLLIVSIIMWYFKGGDDSYKLEVQRIENEMKIIQEKRDSVNLINENLEYKFNEIEKEVDDLKKINIILTEEVNSAERKASISQKQLEESIKRANTLRNIIRDYEENPPKLEGDSLLNSIKKHTNK